MKKFIITLLILSLIGNVLLVVTTVRLRASLQNTEQETVRRTFFVMQGFSEINDILQKAVKEGSIERYELSSLQQQILYTQIGFDNQRHQVIHEINNENYHIFYVYITALEDVIFKIKDTEPLDQEVLNALTSSLTVDSGKYEYGLVEYIQLMAKKMDEAIASLNIQEEPAADGEGTVTRYPKVSTIEKVFIDLFE